MSRSAWRRSFSSAIWRVSRRPKISRNLSDRRPTRPNISCKRVLRSVMPDPIPRIVIVGGGFGGLAAIKALRRTRAQVMLVDRTNHHLFQPLLYQVATSVLAPGNIGFPIRGLVRKQKNATVIMGEVTGVD